MYCDMLKIQDAVAIVERLITLSTYNIITGGTYKKI